jgi:hypothetical protein
MGAADLDHDHSLADHQRGNVSLLQETDLGEY